MTFKKCLRTIQMAKAITLDHILKNGEQASRQISKVLMNQIGDEWTENQVINMMSLYDDVFTLQGFDDRGAFWHVTREVWQRGRLE